MMEATQARPLVAEEQSTRGLTITTEFAAYLGIALLSLVLHLALLDSVPLTNAESRGALAAWRAVYPQAPGSAITADSPILFLAHGLSFTVLGASEFSARIFTALAGVGLILLPALFRGLLGRPRALLFSLLLASSPILLAASRLDRPVVWTLLAAGLALWGFWRFWETAQPGFATWGVVFAVSTVLLTDPAGFVLALALLAAALFAWWLMPTDSYTVDEMSRADSLPVLKERIAAWPWRQSLLVSVLVVLLVGSAFMLYPAGLSGVGELLGVGLRRLAAAQPGTPLFFPLLVTLFYEPTLLVFGIASAVLLLQRGTSSFVERFLFGWLLFGIAATAIYAGAGPEHALWILIPLAGLSACLVSELLTSTRHPIWGDVPWWSRWVLAAALVFLLSMFSIHLQAFSRNLSNMTDLGTLFSQSASVNAVWVFIVILFIIIGYFLASSVWGMPATAKGMALGALLFGMVTSLSSGWHIAVTEAANPLELWYSSWNAPALNPLSPAFGLSREAVSGDMLRLRQTLEELTTRASGGFPQMPVVALASDDGVVAWTLRDFPKAQFVDDLSNARGQGIVIAPAQAQPPDLGGSYVGQSFALSSVWNLQTLRPADLLSWWTQRIVLNPDTPTERVVLWLRQDVYNGASPETQASGGQG
jgi:hypothetical protein